MAKVQMRNNYRYRNSILIKLLIIAVLIAIILFILVTVFQVKNITVEGSNHYTEKEIEELVLKDKYKNTLYLYIQNKYFDDYQIPFIQKVDIEIVSRNDIKIVIYEKVIIGCIEYMGEYLYFDKDGIVVESSASKIEGVPMVTGLMYDKIILHKKLEISDAERYDAILNLMQLIKKYDVKVDKIRFNNKNEIELVVSNIEILLGKDRFFDDKIANLNNILSQLTGLSGELDMKDFKSAEDGVVFRKN